MGVIKDTDYKVEQVLLRSVINTKKLLALELGISRPTLNSRMIGKTKWGKLEKNWIGYIYSKLNNNR